MQKQLIDKELTDKDAIEILRLEVECHVERGRERYKLTKEQFAEQRMRVERTTVYRMLLPGKRIQFPQLMALAYAVELEPEEIDALVKCYDNAQQEYDALAHLADRSTHMKELVSSR